MWLVLDITEADFWPQQFGLEDVLRIPKQSRSTLIYRDRDKACIEAERLSKTNQGRRFAVLGIEDVVESRDMPWAVTRAGKVVSTVRVAVWLGRESA